MKWNMLVTDIGSGYYLRISTDDAPALKSVCPNIPADIDAIVMKCVEREPGRRYESARTLGEDLQRYLEGEPVLARKASLGYRIAKFTRKHKGLVALVAVSFAVATTVFMGGIRARQIAIEEARTAQELGEDVKEMQLFMKYAYGLPTHDIDRERQARKEAPWFYEATVLEADVNSLIGASHRTDGHFDYDKLNICYGRAMDAYRRAAAVASSDPSVHEGACEVLTFWTYAASVVGRFDDADKHFREGLEVSQRASDSDPNRASTHFCRVRIYQGYYNQFRKSDELGSGLVESIPLHFTIRVPQLRWHGLERNGLGGNHP